MVPPGLAIHATAMLRPLTKVFPPTPNSHTFSQAAALQLNPAEEGRNQNVKGAVWNKIHPCYAHLTESRVTMGPAVAPGVLSKQGALQYCTSGVKVKVLQESSTSDRCQRHVSALPQ
jgi:hypothetical protein